MGIVFVEVWLWWVCVCAWSGGERAFKLNGIKSTLALTTAAFVNKPSGDLCSTQSIRT